MSDAFQPISANDRPRFTEIATFMRLPHVPEGDPRRAQVEIGLMGVPFDLGTTNRPGARHGPRQVRDASALIRRAHRAHGMYPFDLARCADMGDALVNPADLQDSLAKIAASVAARLNAFQGPSAASFAAAACPAAAARLAAAVGSLAVRCRVVSRLAVGRLVAGC
jgi:arginase family enzyme